MNRLLFALSVAGLLTVLPLGRQAMAQGKVEICHVTDSVFVAEIAGFQIYAFVGHVIEVGGLSGHLGHGDATLEDPNTHLFTEECLADQFCALNPVGYETWGEWAVGENERLGLGLSLSGVDCVRYPVSSAP